LARKVPLKLRLVEGHVLDTDRELVAAHLHDAIDHQERIAMRKRVQDLEDTGGFEAGGHSPPPSVSSGAPRRASRRRAASSRNHWRTGIAGVPPYRAAFQRL